METFVDALASHVAETIRNIGDMEYCRDAVKIADARNHLFYSIQDARTDEEHAVYALRDLCRLDEETMEWHVDRNRLQSIARDFF